MSLTFREITESNFVECVGLRVRDDQRFVASNVYSIAQSKVEPNYVPMAIYHDDTMVGFAMYELDYDKRQLYLCRFMVDQQYQHMGYGKGALDLLKEMAIADPGIDRIELSTKPDNTYGIKVYERFGFKDTGVMDEDEEVFVLELPRAGTQ
jgi:diamine N-acetyltransferase